MRKYVNSIDKHKEIKVGDQIKILSVKPGYERQYPPVGAVLTVVMYSSTSENVLDCNEYDLGFRTGHGLTYTLVGSTTHLKGIAKFLKEKGL